MSHRAKRPARIVDVQPEGETGWGGTGDPVAEPIVDLTELALFRSVLNMWREGIPSDCDF